MNYNFYLVAICRCETNKIKQRKYINSSAMSQSDASNSQSESSCQSNSLAAAKQPSSNSKPNYFLKHILPGHAGLVTIAKFSPDGEWLASISTSDSFLKIWGAYDGKLNEPMMPAHTLGTYDVAWSNDSRFLVTASHDKTLRIWELSTRRCMKTLNGHTDFVTRCNFCPFSRRILSGSGDKSIRIWDMSTGTCLKTIESAHDDIITSVVYYCDGTKFVSSSVDGTVSIWDAEGTRMLSQKHNADISCVKFSPDGRYSFIAFFTGKIVLVDHLRNTVFEKTFTGPENKRFHLIPSFSMIGGKWIVNGSGDNLICIWDLESREVVQKLSGHTNIVVCVDCHPKEKIIASCALNEGRIILWKSCNLSESDDSNSPSESSCQSNSLAAAEGPSSSKKPSINVKPNYFLKHILPGHAGLMTVAKFSPDGEWLASCSTSDSFLKIWGAYDGKLNEPMMPAHTLGTYDVAWSNDSRFLVTASHDKTLRIWELSTRRCMKTLNGHTDFVTRCNFCPFSRRILSGSGDKSIRIWDMSTGTCLKTIESAHDDIITSVLYYCDGTKFVSSSVDGTVYVWDPEGTRMLSHKHNADISWVKFSPEGRYSVIAFFTGKILLTDHFRNTSFEKTFTGPENKRFHLIPSFSMIGGKWIVNGSGDNLICIWDLESREVVQKLSGHTNTVVCVDCHPKEKIIASCALNEGRIILWKSYNLSESDDSNSPSESFCESNPPAAAEGPSSSKKASSYLKPNYGLIETLPGHGGRLTIAKFSPDGKWLVSCSTSDNFIKIWGAYDGKLDEPMMLGHESGIYDVAWSKDSRFFVTAGMDKTVRIWKLSTRRCMKTLKGHTDFVTCCDFCPFSRRILSGSGDESIRIWDTSTGTCLRTIESAHDKFITSVVYYSDGKRFISSSLDGFLFIWDAEGTCMSTHKYDYGISFVKFSPHCRYTIIAFMTDKIKLLDNLENTSCEKTFTEHVNEQFLLRPSFSMIEGNWIVSGSEDNLIYIYDVESGKVVQTLSGHTNAVMCVDCHPKERIIASCALNEEKIKLWKSCHLSDFFHFMPFSV